MCLLGQSVAEGVVAEEVYETNCAVETPEEVLSLPGTEAQRLGHRRHRVGAVAQECEQVPFLFRQLIYVLGLVQHVLPGDW